MLFVNVVKQQMCWTALFQACALHSTTEDSAFLYGHQCSYNYNEETICSKKKNCFFFGPNLWDKIKIKHRHDILKVTMLILNLFENF